MRNAIHYVKNLTDGPENVPLPLPISLGLPDQRNWGTTYFSSVSIHSKLDAALAEAGGPVDAQWLLDLQKRPGFFDPQISMHNALFAPDARELWVAMGRLPATDGRFNHYGPEIFARPGQ
ncbi:MAG: hypothetical protein IPK07_08370 [Deltaproteobacteria bacterium]|nr:hypothetical protein [Deltaproteobacteria bacterium]